MAIRTKTPKDKNCKLCGKEFTTDIPQKAYCSSECSYNSIKQKGLERARARSEKRLAEKSDLPSGVGSGMIKLECSRCKKEYERYPSAIKHRGSKFCSNKCKTDGNKKTKTKSKLTKELDAVFSRYIRNLYADGDYVTCVTCGKTDEIRYMQNGHYVSRRFYSTRWDIENCHPQCYSCNVGLAGNYAQYSLYMINRYGSEILQTLVDRSKAPYKTTTQELQEKIDYYKGLIEEKSPF